VSASIPLRAPSDLQAAGWVALGARLPLFGWCLAASVARLGLDGWRYVSSSHVAQSLGQRLQLLIGERDRNAGLLGLCFTPAFAIATLEEESRRAPVGVLLEFGDELQLTFSPRAREAVTKLRVVEPCSCSLLGASRSFVDRDDREGPRERHLSGLRFLLRRPTPPTASQRP
jgi:hypothetical protein